MSLPQKSSLVLRPSSSRPAAQTCLSVSLVISRDFYELVGAFLLLTEVNTLLIRGTEEEQGSREGESTGRWGGGREGGEESALE